GAKLFSLAEVIKGHREHRLHDASAFRASCGCSVVHDSLQDRRCLASFPEETRVRAVEVDHGRLVAVHQLDSGALHPRGSGVDQEKRDAFAIPRLTRGTRAHHQLVGAVPGEHPALLPAELVAVAALFRTGSDVGYVVAALSLRV